MKIFKEKEQINFFKTCRSIDLGDNQITILDLREFTNLEHVWCDKNQLVGLSTQGLDRLQLLDCSFNPPLRLNVQGCSSLQKLCYENIPFISLISTGAHPNLIEQLRDLEIELACQKLNHMTIHSPMETDENNEATAQVTELEIDESSEREESIETETADFYSLEEQLLLPNVPGYFPSLENRVPKRKRVPDTEGPESKKTKKTHSL